ncbi:hypothetical protein GCM10010295_47650 [Streptomyces intermedius]
MPRARLPPRTTARTPGTAASSRAIRVTGSHATGASAPPPAPSVVPVIASFRPGGPGPEDDAADETWFRPHGTVPAAPRGAHPHILDAPARPT